MTDILERVWASHWHLKLEVAAEIERLRYEAQRWKEVAKNQASFEKLWAEGQDEIELLRNELATTDLAFQQAVKDCHRGAAEIERLQSTLKLLQADYAALWKAYNELQARK